MSHGVKLKMLGRTDKDGNEYYFTRPNLPMSVDLSKCVFFLHLFEDDGSFEAELVIKSYHKSRKNYQNNSNKSG